MERGVSVPDHKFHFRKYPTVAARSITFSAIYSSQFFMPMYSKKPFTAIMNRNDFVKVKIFPELCLGETLKKKSLCLNFESVITYTIMRRVIPCKLAFR